jgi:hypothetical protein
MMKSNSLAPVLFVTFGSKRFEVRSLEDAAAKWNAYRDLTGAGVSEIGNGVEVREEGGRLVGSVSYNGRMWGPDGSASRCAS